MGATVYATSRDLLSAKTIYIFLLILADERQNKQKKIFFATHTTMSQQPHLRLGSTAPDFKADTTNGPILFHEYIGDSWAILFSHPAARTSVCSTELSAFARLEPEFTKRGVKLLAISADPVEANSDWIDDMEDFSGSRVKFPIIADAERKVATLYDMIDHQDATNLDDKGLQLTIRAVFIIDPSKKIRLIMTYPASTGRNTAEVLRVLDSLQLVDKQKVITQSIGFQVTMFLSIWVSQMMRQEFCFLNIGL